MEVSTPPAQGTPTNGVPPAPFPTIDPERVVEHLVEVCKVALGATTEELEQSGNLLHKSRYSETVSRCTRFATDTQNVLYIQKDIASSSTIENGTENAGLCNDFLVQFLPTFVADTSMQFHPLFIIPYRPSSPRPQLQSLHLSF